MGAISLSCHVILHRLLRPPAPLISFPLLKQSAPLRTTPLSLTPLSTLSPLCSIASAPLSLSSSLTQNDDVVEEGFKVVLDSNNNVNVQVSNVKPPPSLSVKEKKELASYAHSLGKKLKSQQVGKSGVTETVITALIETLEKNELLKLKIHGNCPVELDDAVKQVEEGTGSVVVSQIGRTVILYRPSPTKMKAEEKKKQAQRLFMKKQQGSKRSLDQTKGQIPSQFGCGRRGSNRI